MREVRPAAYDSKIEGNVIFTRLDAAMNWTRKNSLWPMPMGLACCAIELMATAAARFDISRFGAEVMRFSPRQCDVMIVAGTVTYKMALAVKRIYEQMPEPKWVIAMGACASTGGMGGKEALKKLIEIDPTVNAIVSSGYAMDATMSRYQDFGFRGVIAKPYEAAELGKIVHEVIESSHVNIVPDYPMQAAG